MILVYNKIRVVCLRFEGKWGCFRPKTLKCSWCSWWSWRSSSKDESCGWIQAWIKKKRCITHRWSDLLTFLEDWKQKSQDPWERISSSWACSVKNEEEWRKNHVYRMSLRPSCVYGRKLTWCGRKLHMMMVRACLIGYHFNWHFLSLIPLMY